MTEQVLIVRNLHVLNVLLGIGECFFFFFFLKQSDAGEEKRSSVTGQLMKLGTGKKAENTNPVT